MAKRMSRRTAASSQQPVAETVGREEMRNEKKHHTGQPSVVC